MDFIKIEDDVVLRCDYCQLSFGSQTDLEDHLKSGHSADDQELISSLLALASEPGSLFVNAVNPSSSSRSSKNDVFLCGECSLEFYSAEQCSDHVTEVHRKVTTSLTDFKCDIKGCPCNFSTIESLQLHKSCHNASSTGFKCQFENCKLTTFDKWKKCSIHLWKSHGIDLDLMSCPLCPNLRLANPHQLEIHNQTHSDARKYVCSICYKGFKQLAQFRNHAVTHLDKTKQNVPSWFMKKQCDLCKKYFADSKCLKKHVQAVHSKLRPYICQVCNHQSSRKAMIEMHMRQHTGDKPFKYETIFDDFRQFVANNCGLTFQMRHL